MTRRKDGRYQKKITINGKQHCFYSSADTVKKAERDIERQMLAYTERVKNGVTLSELAEDWQNEHFAGIGYNTAQKYKRALKRILADFDGCYANDITSLDVQNYIYRIASHGYARDTVSCDLSVFNQIMRFGVINGDIRTNVCDPVRLPKNLPKSSYPVPSDDDITKIKSSVALPFGLYAYFALVTGLRREELLALTWDDIDFENDKITVNKAVIFINNNIPQIAPPKTKSSEREVILPAALKKLLEKEKNPHGYIFHSDDDVESPLSFSVFRRKYKKYQTASGVTVSSHSLRHGYATILYDAEIDVKTASALLGHSKTEITIDLYTHIREERAKAAADKINNILK